jgi:hypothetical protein
VNHDNLVAIKLRRTKLALVSCQYLSRYDVSRAEEAEEPSRGSVNGFAKNRARCRSLCFQVDPQSTRLGKSSLGVSLCRKFYSEHTLTDAPHQNTSRIKNTRIRISPRTLIINYSTTTYPNKIILNHRVESIKILNLCNSVFLSKAL